MPRAWYLGMDQDCADMSHLLMMSNIHHAGLYILTSMASTALQARWLRILDTDHCHRNTRLYMCGRSWTLHSMPEGAGFRNAERIAFRGSCTW